MQDLRQTTAAGEVPLSEPGDAGPAPPHLAGLSRMDGGCKGSWT